MIKKTPAQAAALVKLNEVTVEFHKAYSTGLVGSDGVSALRDRLISAVAEYETAMQQG